MRRIGQDDGAQVVRAGGAEDTTAEALRHKARQLTAVVEMGVREDDGIDTRGVDGKCGPVAESEILQSLKQAAVHKNPMVAKIEQVLGSGHRAGGTEERQ